jgi:hypothetical protein
MWWVVSAVGSYFAYTTGRTAVANVSAGVVSVVWKTVSNMVSGKVTASFRTDRTYIVYNGKVTECEMSKRYIVELGEVRAEARVQDRLGV